MNYEIVNKLVFKSNDNNKKVIGYTISLGGSYTCGVSIDKAVELGVRDISIANLMDFDEIDVVPIGNNSYGLVSNNSGFFEEFANSEFDYFGDRKLYYGYHFEDRFIVQLNNELALDRMLNEMKGIYKDV